MRRGFTLPELIIVMGIISVLFGLAVVSLLRVQRRPAQEGVISVLTTDIKNQQTKAMVGDTEGSPSSSGYGIYFEANQYTLFRGTTYNSSDPDNFSLELPPTLAFVNITFSDTSLVFVLGSGDTANYSPSANSVSLESVSGGETFTLSVNEYGAVDVD